MKDTLSQEEILQLTSLREVFGGFAHEIAQPLNAIMIAQQVVQLRVARTDLSDEDKAFLLQRLGIVSSQITRASKILEELRVMSKGYAGHAPQTDIRNLFDRVNTLMGQQLVSRGMEVVAEVQGTLPLLRIDRQVGEMALVQGLAFARDSVEAVGDRHQEMATTFKKTLNIRLSAADEGSVIGITWNLGQILDRTPALDPGRHIGLMAATAVLSALGGLLKTTNSSVVIILP